MEATLKEPKPRLDNQADPHEETDLNAPDLEALWQTATEWVEQNQGLALLGSFAVGVFLGAMMRR